MAPRSGLLPVAGGFSQMISAGSVRDPKTGARAKRRQFRLKIAIDESYGPPQARRALAVSRLADIVAMRDALVAVDRGAQAEFLMRKAGAVAGDEEKFNFAIAAANVVMSRPSDKGNEASARFVTWGQLARAWGSQDLARLYPNAGYGKKSAEATDEPRIEYLCKYIENVPLATFNDDDYWRAMRAARERCKTDSTFKQYAQVCRRVLKIGVELRIIPAWPLSAVCKLPIIAKGEAPEFPFLYPEEYARLVRCPEIPIEDRVLWGFIIREGLRLGEAFRIRWEHLAQLPPQPGMRARWVLNVPETKTGRALMFVLNAGSGEVLEALRRLRPELAGPFVWLTATNLKKAAHNLRRHIEISGTERERLLLTTGRLRRLREHDLRSTFVSWCKLAGIDNETIAQHTGHESSTMIARYNRSKATIEHLGLAPYLPLDQAMGLDVAGELGAHELGTGGVPELGAGETNTAAHETAGRVHETTAPAHETTRRGGPRQRTETAGVQPTDPIRGAATDDMRPGQGHPSTPPADLGGVRPLPAVSSGEIDKSVHFPIAPACPECERPLARVQAGARTGWACVSCNAAGEPEGDWLEPVTSPLHEPTEPGNGALTAAGDAGEPSPRSAPATPQRGRSTAQRRPAREIASERHEADRGAAPAASHASQSSPSNEGAKSEPGPGLGGVSEPGTILGTCVAQARAEHLEPLNSRNRRDLGCDPAPEGEGSPDPENEESSRIPAVRERGVEPPRPHGRWNLNPSPHAGNRQNSGKSEDEPAPEGTGSDLGSHPGVTTPATPLELLEAAGRAYFDKRNWAALAALQPLIDAEVARVAEAARATPPEPVRLAIIRAQRERGQR
jgi:integrase